MGFVSELDVQQRGDKDWRVLAPLLYHGDRDLFVVPPGFETDFASVPGAFRWLLPASGRYTKAAVLHDFLWRRAPLGISKSDADGVFRRAMHDLRVPFFRRWLMWAAVRWTSLLKSRFRDGIRDVPRMLLVTLFPGLFVIAGGLVVLVLLAGFFVIESLASLVLAVVRAIVPASRSNVKPVKPPSLLWKA